MENQRATSRYAKACQECAMTKAKCLRQASGFKCERCTRLNKECKARVTATRAPRPPKPNRLTLMEKKLDGLVTLLSASHPPAGQPAAPDSNSFLTPNSLSPDARTCEFGPIRNSLEPVVPLQERSQNCSCSKNATQEGSSNDNVLGLMTPGPRWRDLSAESIISVLRLDEEVAAQLLENYQASMAKYFPFVVIPTSTTAHDLRTLKPFLFLTVMAVSSYQKTGQQTSLSSEIMRLLSEQMLSKGEKSLDLLQGVLVYAEWYHSHGLTDPQLTNVLQLSIALLFDLGLNKSPYASDKHPMVTENTKLLNFNLVFSQSRSNDERRAFLGCFYLTTVVSSCFKKIDALRYTTHVEESCNVLSQHPEYESDIYLIQLVKLQHIAEQITQTLPYDAPHSFWASKPPIGMLVKALQTELQSLKGSLSRNLQNNTSMLQHLESTEIHLFEISLVDQSRHQPSSSRLQTLHSALLATASFLQHFLSLPISTYPSLPFITWTQILHALQVLSKLSLLTDVPGWERTHVREVMDLSVLLDQMVQRFDEARELEKQMQRDCGLSVVASRYELSTQRVRRLKAWYEEKLDLLSGQRGEQGEERAREREYAGNGDVSGAEQTTQPGLRDEFLMPAAMDQFDDAYWQDFLGEWGSF